MLPKTSVYEKLNGCFFLIEYDDLLEKYNTLLNIVSIDIKKEFDRRSFFDKIF